MALFAASTRRPFAPVLARRAVALAVLLLTAALGRADPPAPPPDPVDAWVNRLATVSPAERAALAETLAREVPVDSRLAVVDRTVGRALVDDSTNLEALAAAAAFVRALGSPPADQGLAALAPALESLSEPQQALEKRLRAARVTMQARRRVGDLPGIEAAFAATADDRAQAALPLSPWLLGLEAARAVLGAGRGRQGMEALVALAEQAETLGWTCAAAAIWNEVAGIAHDRRDDLRATAWVERSEALWEAAGAPARAVTSRLNRARILVRLGRAGEALEIARTIEVGARARGVRLLEVETWSVASAALRALGSEAEADAQDLRLVEARVALRDIAGALRARVNWGAGLAEAGRFADALAQNEEALGLARLLGDAYAQAMLLGNQARILQRMGRNADALASAESSLALKVGAARWRLRAQARSVRAMVLGRLGRHEEASRELAEVAAEAHAAGERNAEAEALANQAMATTKAGHSDEAERLLAAARVLYEALGSSEQVANTWVIEAEIAVGRGKPAEAYAPARRAIEFFAQRPLRAAWRVAAHELLARAALEAGDPALSIETAREALRLRRLQSEGLEEGEALTLREHARVVSDTALLAALKLSALPGMAERAAAAALEVVEEGRGLMLAEGIVGREARLRASLPPALASEDALTRRAVEGARRRLLAPEPGDDLARSAAALDEAWKAREASLVRLRSAARRATAWLAPSPMDVAGVRTLLRPDEAFVTYAFAGGRLLAVVARPTTQSLHDLGEAAPLTKVVEDAARAATTSGASGEEALARAHEALLAPLATSLAGAQRWIVCPDGPLWSLPLEALVVRTPKGARRVVETVAITLVPTAGVSAALAEEGAQRPAGRGVLALGEPAGASALAPLPESGREAEEVAALWPEAERTLLRGPAATGAQLEKALSAHGAPWSAVHVASHAFADTERPWRSGLLLSEGEVLDGDRLARLKVEADLVVLSACETAQGTLSSSEGVFGLARTFLLAGAQRVVVTLAPVADRAARDLMVRFHKARREPGVGAAEALARAKRDVIAAGGAEPASWAPFVLIGLP